MRQCIASVAAVLCLCVAFAARADDLEGPTKDTFNKGVAAYDAGNYYEAFKIFSSIDDENLAAMRNVALMLRRGQGTGKDPEAAQAMYERAARGGLATAQADLGEMLLRGEAGPPNYEAAVRWLAFAAEAHHPKAELELGTLYESGSGVPKSIAAARALYAAAAEQGVPEAKARLAALPPPTPEERAAVAAAAAQVQSAAAPKAGARPSRLRK